MTQTRAKALIDARKSLETSGIETAALDARLLLLKACNLTHEDLILEGEVLLTSSEQASLDDSVKRRRAKEPMAYILGRQEFFGRSFHVSPAVLIPRPDTESLVEGALKFLSDTKGSARILDLGTGSGAILLTLLAEHPNGTGLAIDISEEALAVARQNAAALGLEERVSFEVRDWVEGISGPFDLIVSNPPYIPDADIDELMVDVRDFEPVRALSGGPDGLDPLRIIARSLPDLLVPGGAFFQRLGSARLPMPVTFWRQRD